jgi:hypothetical protein
MKRYSTLLVVCVLVLAVQSCRQSNYESDSSWFSTDCSEDIARGSELGITEIPDSMSAYKHAYCKYTAVVAPNGKPIHIFAQNEISNDQLIFARDILAFYLEDVPGKEYGADKSAIAATMTENGAILVMRNGYDGKFRLNIRGLRGQSLYDEEVLPIGTPEYLDTDGYRDASFEEIIHMVQDTGIGIDIEGYDKGAAPEFQKEIRAALNNAHFTNKLWGHGNERRARWIAELTEEGSLTQEYLAAIVDSYYGLWGANKTRETGIGGYVVKTRMAIAEKDPMGYAIMEKFFNPYLTFNARIDSRFEGTFSLTFDAAVPYTNKSQYLVNAILTGDKNSNLTGNDQDNQLSGNSGKNILDGRDGNDTVIFSAPSNQYTISRSEDGIIIEDSVSSRDGTVTLISIEQLQFTNVTLSSNDVRS